MLEIIENLGKWCNNHKMDEKVILINDLKEGHKILKNLSINNYSYINLYVKKIEDIAEESIKTMVIKENKQIISKTIAIDLITNLLKNLKENQQLKYFEELIIDYEISKIFYELIIELKLEKVDLESSQDLNNNKKLQDLQLIIDEYNKELEVKNYLDKADIHILALEKGNLGTGENKHYISLYDETISIIEKEIIEKLIKNDDQKNIKYTLNKDKNNKTQDLKLINNTLKNIKNKENKKKNNKLKNKNNIELFCGYGESNELYEIVRKIKELNVNFEDIAIYHTDDEKYTQRMYELSQLMDIPVSFEDGVSISNTREANLIYKLVEWVKSDYRDNVLYELVDYLYLEKEITQFKIKDMLKELNIGFGKDRYKNIEDRIKYGEIIRDLETLLKILKLNNNNQNTFEGIDKIEEKITKPQIKNILSKLNEEFNKETDTNIEEKYKYSEVVKGLEKILKILKLKNNNNKDIFNINKSKNESENESNDEFKDEYAINLKDKEELDLIFMIIKYIESNYKHENLPTLENSICKDETKVEDINNENTEKNELNDLINKINQNNNYKDKLDKSRELQDIINKLIYNIPDNETTYTEVINGLINILKKFKSKNKKLKSYNQNIFEVFEELKYINEELNINKILENIEKEVRAIKINITKSNDKNGKILFSHYKNGYYNDRKYHFIVGLDSNKFPIKIHENPILLDDEKKQINNNLMLAENLPNKEKLQMLDLIDTRDGKVYISYCNFDFKENKENTPSHLFLELARIVYNDTSLSYEKLNEELKKAHGFTDEKLNRCLSSTEKWLNYHLDGTDISIEKFKEYKSNENNKTLNEIDGYENLYNAFINKNNEEVFDEYDGKIISKELKIIGKKEKSMSPTQIKDFIVCPYKYFLKRELKLYDHKPRTLDYNKWLKPHEFGILMHEVFEEFYKDIIDNNKELDELDELDNNEKLDKHESVIYIKKIAKRLKIEFINTYPSLRNMIYEDTYKSIDSICKNFIKKELKSKGKSTAEYVECEFGNKNEVAIELCREDDGKNDLLYINGKIDRIDKINDNEYKIIDYKSGKGKDHSFKNTKGEKRKDLKKGKNIQNIIYSIASEKLLGKDAKVEDTVYCLVNNGNDTIKEKKLKADEENIEECKAILKEMVCLIENGCFVKCYSKDESNDECKYCEYKNICEFEYDSNVQLNKLSCSIDNKTWKEDIKRGLAFYGE